jgi:hypothetical protein
MGNVQWCIGMEELDVISKPRDGHLLDKARLRLLISDETLCLRNHFQIGSVLQRHLTCPLLTTYVTEVYRERGNASKTCHYMV